MFQQTWHGFLRMMEDVVAHLEGKSSYQQLQVSLRENLDQLGREIMESVIEATDQRFRERREERPGWVITRRDDVKRVLSLFGMLEYRRTYFKHRSSGTRCYLTDEVIGLTPHARIEPALKAQLAERAVSQSYDKSGQWSHTPAWRVSAQTVMKAVRVAGSRADHAQKAGKKRRVQYLYIEADEDHVANQDGPRWQPRLVYVHEGVEKASGQRNKLRNPRYFGGLYVRQTEALWEEVWRYLDAHYDLEHVEVIFVSGDGAAWIRKACEVIPKTVFMLDRFHAGQYISAAAGANRPLRSVLWRALLDGNRRALNDALRRAFEQAETAGRRRTIMRSKAYLNRQWDGILAWKRFQGAWPGCSAEGHVSHVYADRMSSRPMAWRREGVDHMARLRVMQANGQSVAQAYMDRLPARPMRVSDAWLSQAKQSVKTGRHIPDHVLENIPALRGYRTTLTRALRGLAFPDAG